MRFPHLYILMLCLYLTETVTATEAVSMDCQCSVSDISKIPLEAIKTKKCSSKDNRELILKFVKVEDGSYTEKLTWQKFGEIFDSFAGVNAISNGEKGLKGKWQCTDLSHRFLNEYFGIPTKIGMGLGHGDQLAERVSSKFADLEIKSEKTGHRASRIAFFNNDCSPHAPVVGSVVSLKYSKLGHTGVVRKVNVIDANTLEIELFEQHGAKRIKPGDVIDRTKLVLKKNKQGNWTNPNLISWLAVVYK